MMHVDNIGVAGFSSRLVERIRLGEPCDLDERSPTCRDAYCMRRSVKGFFYHTTERYHSSVKAVCDNRD
jgi:hypothetical protein